MAPSATPRIVVVDDSREVTDYVLRLLKEQGIDGWAVNDPLQTAKVADDVRPDLVILDFNMPKLLGPELAALLKTSPAMKDVPILFLSGMTEKVHKDLAAYCGAAAYLEKPINSTKLIHSVYQLLQSRKPRPS